MKGLAIVADWLARAVLIVAGLVSLVVLASIGWRLAIDVAHHGSAEWLAGSGIVAALVGSHLWLHRSK